MSRQTANSRSKKKKGRQPTAKSRPPARANIGQRDRPRTQQAPANRPPAGSSGGRLWLYGRHAVEAALLNTRRTCHQLLATDEALERLGKAARNQAPEIRRVDRTDLDAKLGEHIVHQGLALAVAPLPSLSLEKAVAGAPAGVDLAEAAGTDIDPGGGDTASNQPNRAAVQPDRATVLVLDRVSDPQNLGAILRSAVAFGVRAVIVPHRQSAELGGATAKAASGALDMIPIVEVTNLSRALETLKELGYWRAGLDGKAEQTLDQAPSFDKLALVLGAEGSGIRRLVAEHCDLLLKLPISDRMESLNVSVASGIALYALSGTS